MYILDTNKHRNKNQNLRIKNYQYIINYEITRYQMLLEKNDHIIENNMKKRQRQHTNL